MDTLLMMLVMMMMELSKQETDRSYQECQTDFSRYGVYLIGLSV